MLAAPSFSGDGMDFRLITVMLVSALLTFGCMGVLEDGGAASVSPSGVYREALAPAQYDNAAGSGAYGAAVQYVAKEGSITLKVPEGSLESSYDDMKAGLLSEGAQISDIRYSEYGDRKQYTMTVKVAPSKFESISDKLKEYGEVKDISVSLEDVTRQYVDLDTRIQNKEVELSRLYGMYNKSEKISDLLSVERELTRVATELELLKGQKQYLDSRVLRSTIAISLYEEKPATSQLTNPLENLGALFFGALAAAITLMVVAAGFLLPLALALGLLYIAVARLWKKKQK